MHVKQLLKSSGMTALAAVMAITALPAEAFAQNDERRGWNGNNNRAERVERRGDVRANRIENRTERQANRIERRGDFRANQVQQRTNNAPPRVENWGDRRSAQIQNRTERRADRVERQGQIRADRVDRRSENRAERIERRTDWRQTPGNQRVIDQNRNRTYADRDRNRSYTDRDRNDRRDWRNNDRRDDRRTDWRNNDRRNDYRDARRDDRKWDRRWRDNNRYDWQRYRTGNRHVYHVGRYYSPYNNWSYRRLSIGFFMNSLFYSNRYWINDPYEYRLPAAYGPYRWIRYYDDVLLVNIYSGEVVDVIYDFFW